MSEPLAHNRQIRDRAALPSVCVSPSQLLTTQGRAWMYLRDVRAAVLQAGSLDAAVLADLGRVLPMLPAGWLAHVQRPDPLPAPSWSCAQLADGTELVCLGACPFQDAAGLFVVLDMGRMKPAGDTVLPPAPALLQLTWVPCLVITIPKL